MKVLYFHQHFSTPEGAAGTRSYEMSRRLLEAGHHVTVVCGHSAGAVTGLHGEFTRGKRTGDVEGVQVIEFELPYSNSDSYLRRSWTFLRFAFRSAWLAVRERYDVLFATSTPLTAAIPGVVARWLRFKPFVFEVRDLWPELPKSMGVITNPVVLRVLELLEWVSYHSAHAVIGLSPGMVDGIASRGVPRERIRMIPNGCDLDLFRPDLPTVAYEGIVDGDFVATFTGAHGLANGLDAVIDVAEELSKRSCHSTKIVLVGQGSEKNRLTKKADSLGLENVLFLEPMSKPELAAFLCRADVGLMVLANVPAFYRGTSPNKFFDYLSAGLPIICNYPGWMSDLLEDGGCGLEVPPNDPAKFADAIMQLESDRRKVCQMGQNARAMAEARFSRNEQARSFVACIEESSHRSGRDT